MFNSILLTAENAAADNGGSAAGILGILLGIIWTLVCFGAAKIIAWRSTSRNDQTRMNFWGSRMIRLLSWVFSLVTLALLLFFGVIVYAVGMGIPSVFWVLVCTGVALFVFRKAANDTTTETLLHSSLSSLGLAVICITAVNGTVGLLAFTNFKNICIWFLTCVIATVAIRAVLWIRESR